MNRCAVAGALAVLAAPSSAHALTLYGKASTYGNDPVLRLVDRWDNNLPRLGGATNDRPGIAVFNLATLGHWWRVCSPAAPNIVRGCRWVRQTDLGPQPPRVVDINAVAVRVLWRGSANTFPTDQGVWKLVLHGRELYGGQLREARYERCATRRCRIKWAVAKAGAR